MPRTNKPIVNTVGGEISPLVSARIDLPLFQKALARCENFIVLPQGGARFRNGTKHVKYTRNNQVGTFIPFQFNDTQAYLIEVTDQKFRFYKDNSVITETADVINAATNANPGVFTTSAAHGFSVDDEVYIDGIVGMSGLNGKFFKINSVPTGTTFSLKDIITGTAVNTTTFGTYVSGGTASRVYEITTPYVEADIAGLSFAQNADTMYIAHRNYEPRKLTRAGHANWTLATYVRTSDPFTASTKWPRAVTFLDTARLMFGGTADNPETVWASQSPNGSTTRYDDFTTGSSATNGFIFTLAPVHGKVDAIQWLTNVSKFVAVGTFGSIRRLYGATEQEPISPTSVTAKSVNAIGCSYSLPISNGNNLFYIQRGDFILRSLEYDLGSDGYTTIDRNLVADHLTRSGLKQGIEQQGQPDVIWISRNDGKLIGLTYKEKEDISGWHRHSLGGSHVNSNNVTQTYGKVLWVARMPRPTAVEQLWLIVERVINGATVRSVEYMDDVPVYPIRSDFYTGVEATDKSKYLNALFEVQKDANHLDMAVTYDGSASGVTGGGTMTPGSGATVQGTAGVTFTAGAAVFTAAMVGREIWKKYDSNGDGGGRARITGYTNSTTVTCTILSAFDSVSAIAAGNWLLTASVISGLDHLEGQTVYPIADGGPHTALTVTAGSVTLNQQASKVHVGLKYRGIIQTLNLDSGGESGTAAHKPRSIINVVFSLLNTLGIKFGSDIYNTEQITFRSTEHMLDRPPPPANESVEVRYSDRWNKISKEIVVLQEQPVPCTILGMDIFMDTADE